MIEHEHQVVGIAIAVRSLVDVAHQHVVDRDERGEPRPPEQRTPSLEESRMPFSVHGYRPNTSNAGSNSPGGPAHAPARGVRECRVDTGIVR